MWVVQYMWFNCMKWLIAKLCLLVVTRTEEMWGHFAELLKSANIYILSPPPLEKKIRSSAGSPLEEHQKTEELGEGQSDFLTAVPTMGPQNLL